MTELKRLVRALFAICEVNALSKAKEIARGALQGQLPFLSLSDMTPEQKAAFIQAQTQLMVTEREVMLAEDREREHAGRAPVNGPGEWRRFLERWEAAIGHNAVIGFFRE